MSTGGHRRLDIEEVGDVTVAKFIDKIRDTAGQEEYTNGGQQGAKFLTRIQGGDFTA